MKNITEYIRGEYIRLCDLLKFTGMTGTGGEAKEMILEGEVKVDGEVCLQRTKKIRAGQVVEYNGISIEVKSASE